MHAGFFKIFIKDVYKYLPLCESRFKDFVIVEFAAVLFQILTVVKTGEGEFTFKKMCQKFISKVFTL